MLDEQGNFNLNLGEYLQRAKVLAALDPEMPHAIADSVVGPDGPNMIGGNAPREMSMGDSVVPRPIMPGKLNPQETILSPEEFQGFKGWKDRYAPTDSGQDYDLQGAYKAGIVPDARNGHFPDTFKKTNHPTFSNESQYAPLGNPGHWQGDTFIPPGQQQPLPETRNYMDTVRKEPLKEQYHPSKTRNVLSKIAGIGVGMFNPALGEYVNDKISNAPFNRQMEEFGQREQRDKVLMDTERGMYKDLSTENLQGAQAEHQLALSGKESTPEVLRAKLTDGREVNVKINPQGRYIDTDTGNILAGNVIESVNKVGTPQRTPEDNSPLGHFIRAQKLLDDPKTAPEIKKGAQVTVDNFLTKKTTDKNLNAQTILWAEEIIAKYETDPTSVPDYEYKAAVNVRDGSKAKDKPKVETYRDAQGNLTATVIPTADELKDSGGFKKLGNVGAASREPQSSSDKPKTRGMLSGDVNRIAEMATSLTEAESLKAALSGVDATGVSAQVGAAVPDWFNNLTGGWANDAKKKDAVIQLVKQIIGKSLEGGVLRKEDELKYAKIIPKIGDPASVVASKIAMLQDTIKSKRQELIETLGDAGFDTSKFGSRGGSGKKSDPLGIL